jgi:hypothetical protein
MIRPIHSELLREPETKAAASRRTPRRLPPQVKRAARIF